MMSLATSKTLDNPKETFAGESQPPLSLIRSKGRISRLFCLSLFVDPDANEMMGNRNRRWCAQGDAVARAAGFG